MHRAAPTVSAEALPTRTGSRENYWTQRLTVLKSPSADSLAVKAFCLINWTQRPTGDNNWASNWSGPRAGLGGGSADARVLSFRKWPTARGCGAIYCEQRSNCRSQRQKTGSSRKRFKMMVTMFMRIVETQMEQTGWGVAPSLLQLLMQLGRQHHAGWKHSWMTS